eukprot:TRINITY_DN16789_c0_g1_i3.p1 TRINITY_DN16789_c0_g1~~TRINITY_DN16789_c0_g1_i3.p1  ORF type:complete len:183 (-),score=45.79 TRINITY_DN16789_c0_g1_i3:2-550(-)
MMDDRDMSGFRYWQFVVILESGVYRSQCSFFFFLMIRRPPRSTQGVSSAASDVYKRQVSTQSTWVAMKIENGTFGSVAIYEKNNDGFAIKHQFTDNFRPLDIGDSNNSGYEVVGLNLETLYILSLIHISEPTRPLYISYAVFCLKKKKKKQKIILRPRKYKKTTNKDSKIIQKSQSDIANNR